MNQTSVILLVVLATFIGAFGSLFLKLGSSKLSRNILSQIKNYKLILGIFLYVVSSIFYIWALKFSELSLVYPLTSLSYVWVMFISSFLLREKMNSYKWYGVIFIIGGIILITR